MWVARRPASRTSRSVSDVVRKVFCVAYSSMHCVGCVSGAVRSWCASASSSATSWWTSASVRCRSARALELPLELPLAPLLLPPLPRGCADAPRGVLRRERRAGTGMALGPLAPLAPLSPPPPPSGTTGLAERAAGMVLRMGAVRSPMDRPRCRARSSWSSMQPSGAHEEGGVCVARGARRVAKKKRRAVRPYVILRSAVRRASHASTVVDTRAVGGHDGAARSEHACTRAGAARRAPARHNRRAWTRGAHARRARRVGPRAAAACAH